MKKIWVHKAKSFKDAEEWDRKFWRRAGAQARFAAACSMVKDYLKMKGKSEHLLRLQRTVQRIKRRG
ncbi:MAG: hypothetical protein A3D87_05670 [Omnitrophica WOR_2 bacterium RIFCSPHIGHO2_02_FULL_50_17]|nr:MAG: hypothetical protein A3D87_05670 [Omnitrophica WOR_2 bacterium RIFCSPHIGHO2_02_FULL_50_17]